MKKYLLPFILCLVVSVSYGQTGGRFTLKGIMADTAGAGLPEATVMLLMPKDSSLVNFGRTGKDGSFEFRNLKRVPYLLKVTYVGYLPHQQTIQPGTGDVVDLGSVKLSYMDQNLYEVVVKAFRAPLSIKGDTIEYDPKAFKIPQGANVEELIRRLPGMQVDQDGNIRAQGESVKRVTVDGKRFFGDDVKAATKNLPAEAISKVQVFNEKSEQSRITGVDDGKRDKTLNLQLKDSHKKGGFGKASLGVGTDKRLEGKINYNRFNEKNQFSVLGLGSNTNSGGMNWDDYQDFKGSQSMNWGDDGDFGFGGGVRYISFGGDDDESLTIQAGSGSVNRGFNKNYAGGANYNYDTKKTKFNTSYYYNQRSQDLDATSFQTTFLNNSAFTKLDTNGRRNFNENHRGTIRFEKTLDSLNTLIFLSNVRLGNGSTAFKSHQEYFSGERAEAGKLSNVSDFDNTSDFNSFAMANTLIFRHKFNKKGRNFAASLGYNVNNSEGNNIQRSLNQFFRTSQTEPDSVFRLNQSNDTRSLRNQFKGSLLFIEPLSKIFVLESFYNYSLKTDDVDRNVFDIGEGTRDRNLNLSRYYKNSTDFNRVGTALRYSKSGLNVSVGMAGQQIHMDGKYSIDQDDADKIRIDRKFFNWTPNVNINYDLKRNRYLYGGYNMQVSEPNIRDLQPIVDNSNPLYIRVGNPSLVPQISQTVNLGFSYFNPSSFIQMYMGFYYSYFDRQVVYNQTVDENLITTTRPININGGNSGNLYVGYGFPIVKTKATINFNVSTDRSFNPTFINGVSNETKSNGYNGGFRLDLTPNDKFTFYGNANWSLRDTRYSIMSAQNQKFVNATYGAELNYKFPKDIYFNSRFNYNSYVNSRYNFDQKIPILNLSVYKTVLKNKKGEIRLSAYDVFNQNRGISQSAYMNFVSQEQVRTLARYFMLSFAYNMRGMSHSVKRKGYGY